MLIVLSTGGKIKSSLCKLNCNVNENFIKVFYALCSRYFIGTALEDVNIALLQSTSAFLGEYTFDMLPLLTTLCSLCSETAKSSLLIEGETNLIAVSYTHLDIAGVKVNRPENSEATALGAAYLAGLAVGVWDNMEEIEKNRKVQKIFVPSLEISKRNEMYTSWKRAVERSRNWER